MGQAACLNLLSSGNLKLGLSVNGSMESDPNNGMNLEWIPMFGGDQKVMGGQRLVTLHAKDVVKLCLWNKGSEAITVAPSNNWGKNQDVVLSGFLISK